MRCRSVIHVALAVLAGLLLSACAGAFDPGEAEVGSCFVDPDIKELGTVVIFSDELASIDCEERHLGQVIGNRRCDEVFERFAAKSSQAISAQQHITSGYNCIVLAERPRLLGQYVDGGPEEPSWATDEG